MTELLAEARRVERELEAAADPARAHQMAAYMRHQFAFLGVPSKPRKQAQKQLLRQGRNAHALELLAVTDWCWQRPHRELQYVGMDLLRAVARNLTVDQLPDVRRFIETRAWWDTVDSLAAHTVGSIVRADRAGSEVMDRWVDDADVWVARTAILHQLAWKHDVEPDRLFDYALRQSEHTDFFIRKAIGWALRTLARTHPDAVRHFVDDHAQRLSGLTIREATKHL